MLGFLILILHLYRREGNEDQSYPHDTLLGFRRTGITILNKILLCYLAVINKSRKFEKRNGENPSPFTLHPINIII